MCVGVGDLVRNETFYDHASFFLDFPLYCVLRLLSELYMASRRGPCSGTVGTETAAKEDLAVSEDERRYSHMDLSRFVGKDRQHVACFSTCATGSSAGADIEARSPPTTTATCNIV